MDSDFGRFYEAIGQEALAHTYPHDENVLIYSEVEDGVTTCGVFYEASGKVIYRECSLELDDLIYDFWNAWRDSSGNTEWRAMSYEIKGGEFNIRLTYPDQIDPEEPIIHRRPRVIFDFFGDIEVVYDRALG